MPGRRDPGPPGATRRRRAAGSDRRGLRPRRRCSRPRTWCAARTSSSRPPASRTAPAAGVRTGPTAPRRIHGDALAFRHRALREGAHSSRNSNDSRRSTTGVARLGPHRSGSYPHRPEGDGWREDDPGVRSCGNPLRNRHDQARSRQLREGPLRHHVNELSPARGPRPDVARRSAAAMTRRQIAAPRSAAVPQGREAGRPGARRSASPAARAPSLTARRGVVDADACGCRVRERIEVAAAQRQILDHGPVQRDALLGAAPCARPRADSTSRAARRAAASRAANSSTCAGSGIAKGSTQGDHTISSTPMSSNARTRATTCSGVPDRVSARQDS